MVNNIKIGLIGCGKQAEKHIQGFNAIGVTEILVSDIRRELADSLAGQFAGVEAVEIDALLNDPSVRIVDVCTPTPSHFEYIARALKSGKDVFCEKPLCATAEEAQEIQRLEKSHGRFVQVGYIYRFAPAFSWCKRLLQDNQSPMGTPLKAFLRIGGRGSHQTWKHTKSQGGGAINEMLVHMLDLALWFFGPLKDIQLVQSELLMPQRVIKRETVTVDAEDLVLVTAKSAQGTRIIIEADMLTPAFRQYVEIQGTNSSYMGSIQADMPSYIFLSEARGQYEKGKTNLQFKAANLFNLQLTALLENVRHGYNADTPGVADSIEILKIMTSINQR